MAIAMVLPLLVEMHSASSRNFLGRLSAYRVFWINCTSAACMSHLPLSATAAACDKDRTASPFAPRAERALMQISEETWNQIDLRQ
jgi:hypothetical protein